MKVTIILNPYANRWKGLEKRSAIQAAFDNAGLESELLTTDNPGHGTELAFAAAESGTDAIFAAGGDGTINEVVNGMMQSSKGSGIPLGVLPIGTANDLVANNKLPHDFAEIAQAVKDGGRKKIDVISVNDRYFSNNSGLGLEPYVSTVQNRMTKVRGIARYLLATFKGILDNPSWEMELKWDDGEYKGPITLISIANSPLTGGVFYTVPHADPTDGKLTFIYGHVEGRLNVMQALPMIFKPEAGNITEHPNIQEVHSTRLTVKTTPTPAHTDGEIFTLDETEFTFEVHPGRLTLLTG
jgi:diacylglycerol kinase (ATP)